jgi:photosystem II stability/assembly factor-like uncharacterized protein
MMKSFHTLLRVLKILPVPLLVVMTLFSAAAQSTGEWTTTWESPSNNTADFPRVVATAGPGNYVIATGNDLYRTTDAGITWKSILNNGGSFTLAFTYVSYPTPNQLIVLTDSSIYENGKYVRYGTIAASSNGGATWQEHRFDGKRWLRGVSMADANTGLVAMQIPVEGAADSLLLTTDGGATWQGFPLPPKTRFPSNVYCLSSDSWGLVAYDSTEKNYHFYRTTNRGAEWRRATNLPEGWSTIRLINESLAWTVGGVSAGLGDTRRDLIARSTDGGITWTTVLDTLLDFRFGLTDIDFADENNGIAVGGYGKILRTTDGGTTWHQEWPPSELIAEYINMKGVAYPAPDEAIAIGSTMNAVAYRGNATLMAPQIILPNTSLDNHPVQTIVEWKAIEGATSYDLQIGDTAYDYNFVSHRIFDVPYFERTGLTQTSIAVTLQLHTRYAIRVRAHNGTQTSDWSVRVNLLTEGEGKTLATPLFTAPKNSSQNIPLDVDLKWTSIPGATGYDLRVALEPSFLITEADEENLSDTTYHLQNLKPATVYYARVRARDADGITSEWTGGSEVLVFITEAVASADRSMGIDFALSLRPNVTADHAALQLDLSRDEDVEVRVVDMQGNDITAHASQRLTIGTHLLPIDVSTLAGGNYFVVVSMHGVQQQLPLTVVR